MARLTNKRSTLVDDLWGGEEGEVEAEEETKKEVPVTMDSPLQDSPPPLDDQMPVKIKRGPQIVDHLPVATTEALSTYTDLDENEYKGAGLGIAPEDDIMVCECQYIPGDPDSACGPDCINRQTQIECLASECRCGSRCQNQKFQRHEYAKVEIVATERKGYGLRAAGDIGKDVFIYEYMGEIVPQPSFLRRMQEYSEDGIRHFYFMMLQSGEFIDATKKGCRARFINHSCAPNCYVAKWVVGRKLRVGIFAKRKIQKGEELTFNYNVDRYGAEAQPCYCGEPDCVEWIGGKKQTDISTIDGIYLEALGLDDDGALLSPSAIRRRKKDMKRDLDDDFSLILKPLREEDVPKVVAAVRQARSNRKILPKLLMRIKMSDEEVIQRRIIRLHGFTVMKMVLGEYLEDMETAALILQILDLWPMIARNKIVDSKIEEEISKLTHVEDEEVRTLSNALIVKWSELEMGYRIRRRMLEEAGEEIDDELLMRNETRKRQRTDSLIGAAITAPEKSISTFFTDGHDKPVFIRPEARRSGPSPHKRENSKSSNLPEHWRSATTEDGKVYYYHTQTQEVTWKFPQGSLPSTPHARSASSGDIPKAGHETPLSTEQKDSRAVLQAIIEKTRREAEAKREAEMVAQAALREQEKAREKRREHAKLRHAQKRAAARASSSASSLATKEERKEKKLKALIGPVVVRVLSKYKAEFADKEVFKSRASELTSKILTREKQSSSYIKGELDRLSTEKETKIIKYAKESHVKWRKLQKDIGRRNGEQTTNGFHSNGLAEPAESAIAESLPVGPDSTETPDVLEEDAEVAQDVQDSDLEGVTSPSDIGSPLSESRIDTPVHETNLQDLETPPPPPPIAEPETV